MRWRMKVPQTWIHHVSNLSPSGLMLSVLLLDQVHSRIKKTSITACTVESVLKKPNYTSIFWNAICTGRYTYLYCILSTITCIIPIYLGQPSDRSHNPNHNESAKPSTQWNKLMVGSYSSSPRPRRALAVSLPMPVFAPVTITTWLARLTVLWESYSHPDIYWLEVGQRGSLGKNNSDISKEIHQFGRITKRESSHLRPRIDCSTT